MIVFIPGFLILTNHSLSNKTTFQNRPKFRLVHSKCWNETFTMSLTDASVHLTKD